MIKMGAEMADVHWDVQWHDSRGQWMVVKDHNGKKISEAHRKRKKDAVNKAKGIAQSYVKRSFNADQAEVHVYTKTSKDPQRIDVVENN